MTVLVSAASFTCTCRHNLYTYTYIHTYNDRVGLSGCLHVYVHTCTYLSHTYILAICIYAYTHVCIARIDIHTYIHTYPQGKLSLLQQCNVYIYVYIYICIYICIHTCMHCTYRHTYIHKYIPAREARS